MSSTGFCIRFGIAVVVVAALVALTNAVIDPYLMFDAPRWSGFNARKPAAETRERLIKAYDGPRHRASTLILGSSRSDIGLDPEHAAWLFEAGPVYNMSIAGSDTRIALRYLQHFVALQVGDEAPRTVLVGLDFEYSLMDPRVVAAASVSAPKVSETEARLTALDDGRPNQERALRTLQDRGAALLSLDALTDSVATVIASARGGGATLGSSGQLSEDVFRETVAADGVATLFAQKNVQTLQQYGVPHQLLRPSADGSINGMKAVEDLVEFAHLHRIEVVLFVQPAHADRMELLDRMGYWEDFEEWKIALAEHVDSRKAIGYDVRLYDFGGYERYSQESVPLARDRTTRLQWFWEPAHYRSELGDLMLKRMLRRDEAESYGVELRLDNVHERLAEVRRARLEFRNNHPEQTKRVGDLYCTVLLCAAPPEIGTAHVPRAGAAKSGQ